jgi:hypothetical protein
LTVFVVQSGNAVTGLTHSVSLALVAGSGNRALATPPGTRLR